MTRKFSLIFNMTCAMSYPEVWKSDEQKVVFMCHQLFAKNYFYTLQLILQVKFRIRKFQTRSDLLTTTHKMQTMSSPKWLFKSGYFTDNVSDQIPFEFQIESFSSLRHIQCEEIQIDNLCKRLPITTS